MRLTERVALVTGAGRGIGAAIARRFADEGATVVVNDIVAGLAEETVAEIRAAGGSARTALADVADQQAVSAMVATTVAECGGLDIVVNNALPNVRRLIEEDHELAFDVIVRGGRQIFEAALDPLRASPHPAVIFIASVNGMMAIGKLHVYSAAKAAVLSYVRTLAVQHGREGIRVNAISPGSTRTDVWAAYAVERPDVLDEVVPFYPLGRVAEPAEIAAAAAFLASDDASFVTGHNLVVDGGLTAGHHRWETN